MYEIDLRYHAPAGQISVHASGELLSEVMADVLRDLKRHAENNEKLDIQNRIVFVKVVGGYRSAGRRVLPPRGFSRPALHFSGG